MATGKEPWDAEWCEECEWHLSLHFGEDDCAGAEARGRLVEQFGAIR